MEHSFPSKGYITILWQARLGAAETWLACLPWSHWLWGIFFALGMKVVDSLQSSDRSPCTGWARTDLSQCMSWR